MIALELNREITLPKDNGFYSTKRVFPVELAGGACSTYTDTDGKSFTLEMSPAMRTAFTARHGRNHAASLGEITECAMRFYRTGTVAPFNFAEFMDELFLLRNDFGHAFRPTKTNSLGGNPYEESKRHAEASRHSTELFGYGLSVHFLAHALGIPIERFFFITKAGVRADFHARITAREMVAAGAAIHLINPAGQVVRLEVKAKTGWGSFRGGADGADLGLNLAKKAAGSTDKIFCGLLIAIAGRGPAARGKTKILIADPGDPDPLPLQQQADIILDELLTLSLRFGLHEFAKSVLSWMIEDADSRELATTPDGRMRARRRTALLARLPSQPRWDLNVSETIAEEDDRVFVGSTASELLTRIGTADQRRITRPELEELIRLRRLGSVWFRGVDQRIVEIISQRDIRALLAYGVRGAGGPDLSGRSAFRVEEAVADDKVRDTIASIAYEQLQTLEE